MTNIYASCWNIEKISIQNFKSLRDPTTLYLSPITFIYGPNSAGKSSILDALKYIDTVFNGSEWEINSLTEQWQHRDGNKERKPLQITVVFKHTMLDDWLYVGVPNELGLSEGRLSEFYDHSNRWELIVEASANRAEGALGESYYTDIGSDFYYDSVIRRIQLSFAGSVLINFSGANPDDQGGRLQLHPDLFKGALEEIVERHGYATSDDDVFAARCFADFKPLSLSWTVGYYRPDLERDWLTIANSIIERLRSRRFSPNKVGSDRAVIRDDLSVVFRKIKTPFSREGFEKGFPDNFQGVPNSVLSNIIKEAPPFVERLLKSYLSESVKCDSKEASYGLDELDDDSSEYSSNPIPKESLYEFVNRCLSGHLFIDNGYAIKYHVLNVGPIDSGVYLVICNLIDTAGRSLTFSNVGTGISCVLPILVATYSGSSFLQQPELHLHPALQSALGDVLIEAARINESSNIIETHSEYILLRCLRRIRQTKFNEPSSDGTLSLRHEDLAVYYFEPQLDGCTKVKRIRISTNGEFVDRWPRGFFDERGKELFDE